MPVFVWEGKTAQGKILKGEMEAVSQEVVFARLRSQRIQPIPARVREKGKGLEKELTIPVLYVMGEEDYMFLPSVRKVVEKHCKSSQLFVIEQCGHVVNVEQPNTFNQAVISFINTTK